MKRMTIIIIASILVCMMIAVSSWDSTFKESSSLTEKPEVSKRPGAVEKEEPEKEKIKPLGERPRDGWKFGFSSMGSDADYYVEVENLLRGYIHQEDDRIISMNPAGDSKLQAEQLREMMKRGVDAIFLDPIDVKELEPVLAELKEHKIPIVNLSLDKIETEISEIDSDNFNSGFILGDYMVNYCKPGESAYKKAKIVVFSERNQVSEREAIYGFRAAIGDSYFAVERELVCGHDKELIEKELESAVEEIEDLKYVFSLCDEMTLSILEVCKEKKYDNLTVFTIGGSPRVKQLLQNNNRYLAAIAAKSPSSFAMNAYGVMMQYLAGYDINKQYLTETFLLTKENIWDYPVDVWQ